MEQRDVEHHLGHRLRGNVYQLAVPTARGSGISQAIYYAKNIKAAAAGANTVTVTFNTATPYVDLRALEYSGLDLVNPFDVGASASGTSTFGEQRRGYDDRRARTHLRCRNRRLVDSRRPERFHHPHHHLARPRHCRRSVRDRYRELQRHRIARGVRGMGDAGRDLQGGQLAPS